METDKLINAKKLKEAIKDMHCSQCVSYDKERRVCLDNEDCETYNIFNIIDRLHSVDSLRVIKNPCSEYSNPIVSVNTDEVEIKDQYEPTLYRCITKSATSIDVDLVEHFVLDTTDYAPTSSPPTEKIEKQAEGSDLYG